MKNHAAYWIEHLGLESHPEGGYFKEVYRSEGTIPSSALPDYYASLRNYATSIYFLLTSDQVSKFHILQSDELWYFHAGSSLTIYTIDISGNLQEHLLGPDLEKGEMLQVVVPARTYFAASVNHADTYTLVGCVVAPGFTFDDFSMPGREELLEKFPAHWEYISRLS